MTEPKSVCMEGPCFEERSRLYLELKEKQAENSRLLSVVTRLADQGYWSKRVTEASLRAILDEYVDYARGALALIKGDG